MIILLEIVMIFNPFGTTLLLQLPCFIHFEKGTVERTTEMFDTSHLVVSNFFGVEVNFCTQNPYVKRGAVEEF